MSPCACAAATKPTIEALGVPHTEVELILVCGKSASFDHIPCHGERVAVYPKFESLDITPLLRVRTAPPRVTRFVADRVPEGVRQRQQHFSTCDCCQYPLWQGSHWQHMQALVEELPPFILRGPSPHGRVALDVTLPVVKRHVRISKDLGGRES